MVNLSLRVVPICDTWARQKDESARPSRSSLMRIPHQEETLQNAVAWVMDARLATNNWWLAMTVEYHTSWHDVFSTINRVIRIELLLLRNSSAVLAERLISIVFVFLLTSIAQRNDHVFDKITMTCKRINVVSLSTQRQKRKLAWTSSR